MIKRSLCAAILFAILSASKVVAGEAPRFHAVVFYSTDVEGDHVQFADAALKFLSSIASKDQFQIDTTTDWNNLNEAYLMKYQLVIWLNESPKDPKQRVAFQEYMEHGGAWLGFHFAGYNDQDTHWPWYVDFLGGAVFSTNSWPPLPARLTIDERTHPVTANLPESYVAPQNEWYIWNPSPRLNRDVRVLVTLDPTNYPLGLKDVLLAGDCPVVWTNTKYKMVYMNMGHGGKILTNSTQNQLIENAVVWLGTGAQPGRGEEPVGVRVSPQAVAANPETKKIYAVNTNDRTVTVVSAAGRVVKKVKAGKEPSTIGINPVTNRIYVGNAGDGTVTVIDGSSDQVMATVSVGELPYVVAVNSADNQVYISKTFSNTTTVIDGATNEVRILDTGIQATAILADAASDKSYLINQGNSLTVLDGARGATSKIRAGDRAWGLALNPVTGKIYMGDTNSSMLAIVDAKTGSASAVNVGEMPVAIAVDTAANRVYVANYAGNSVTVLDGTNDAVLATIPVGTHPQAISADAATHTIYVANTGSHSVSVIDGNKNSVLRTVDVGTGPYAIAVAGDTAYVKVLGRDDLFAIDPHTLAASIVSTKAGQQ
jgi:uncharacterized protein